MEILKDSQFNSEVRQKGETIFRSLESESGSIFNKDWWYGKIMDWSMKDEKFKTQMFRFVDVLPYLNSNQEVSRHLKEYFAESDSKFSSLMSFGTGIGALAPGLMAGAIRKNITQMAKMFITGENPKEALSMLKKTREQSLGFTADLLGEATLSEKEALEYQSRYIELIDWLCRDANAWPANPLLDSDDRGPIPRVNVSVKLTALYSQISEKAWSESIQTLKERMRPIFTLAKERQVFINIDMEQYKYKDLTLSVFKELLLEPEFRDYPHFGIVIQAYLRDSLADVRALADFAKKRGTSVTVRLVKGAYWDYETLLADQNNWAIPVYTVKQESDANYEACAYEILKNNQVLRLAAGTHNVRSMAAVMTIAERFKLDKKAYEIQMLYGMAEPIKKALVKQGIRVREYATIGELIPGMAYLVRRLLENTSNESFLRSKFAENTTSDVLLKNPGEGLNPSPAVKPKDSERFYNEPLVDFVVTENREKMKKALADYRREFGQTIPILIDGKKVSSNNLFERENPSKKSEIVGRISMATKENAETAVQKAKEAYKTWQKTPADKRAQILTKWADLMRRDRYRLMAIEVFETGKPWSEADGDVAEAIDFCDYYAREAVKLATPVRVSYVTGESSLMHYKPRGVSLVIAPWNFPLAILCGMTAASLVTGNTVVVKPAEQSSIIAYEMMKLLFEAGCPASAAQFVPGYGEEVGRYLVNHKDVALISFTGSKNVGLEIVKAAAEVQATQHFVKKCIIEMGGKNAIIVDSDADLDEAVVGILYSAFGFSGQKCSAASRVIVLEENYDRFINRIIEAARSIQMRSADDPHAYLGPVVDKEAYDRIMATIERHKATNTLAFQSGAVPDGYFVPPTIFTDVKPDSELAQEEIFGPVLAIIKAKDLDDAIEIANNSKYALTGGVFSRSPANIERIKEELDCGNLYVNRGITGALVGRHPFGGYKLSGLGSKTGGKDYLLNYVEPRVVTENTMRRGFAPPEETATTGHGA
jgi:RHH-type transcriptional regulator, proline utilization regulon repressor / proline dehydrogenase / delta 1-pyrroline-5-carboxylate dehydrogenase